MQRKSEDTKGFLKRAFLNYFPNIFPSITLDYVANKQGKEFFRKLLNESKKKGFKTIIINQITKEETPYEEDEFEQYWGSYNLVFKIYFQ